MLLCYCSGKTCFEGQIQSFHFQTLCAYSVIHNKGLKDKLNVLYDASKDDNFHASISMQCQKHQNLYKKVLHAKTWLTLVKNA